MNIPSNLKYTKDHSWVRLEEDIATIGITYFAQKQLGNIVYIETKFLNQTLPKDIVFGTVEAIKTASDLFLPLSGQILIFNNILENQPEKLNLDPYGEGWVIKIKISNPLEIESLLSSDLYKKFISE